MRGQGKGEGGYGIIFRNIRVEDPRPTLQPFKLIMESELNFIDWNMTV